MRSSRVIAIFRKELTDILRDRRTLIGMVVIPVLLYPALILTFGPAEISRSRAIKQEPYIIVVADAPQGRWLEEIIKSVLDQPDPNLADTRPSTASTPVVQEAEPDAAKVGRPGVILLNRHRFSDPNEAVRTSPDIHVAVTLSGDPEACRSGLMPLDVTVAYDGRDLRSIQASRRTKDLLDEYAAREQIRLRKQIVSAAPDANMEARLHTLLDPVRVDSYSITTTSIFLQIMPVILVLMTVTGAVYPAIDLTAGERERGTLETLMVAPVPTLEVVTGKFLVVMVVGLITALLNVISVGASVRLVHVEESLAMPLGHLLITLAAIIPLSMLFSAVLLVVCSFARSFKEAQNYVMPVVIAAVVPAIMGALPGVTLSGAARVVPVENIVVLVRELVTRDTVPVSDILIVLLSTSLYAGGAIAVASRLFGQEAVTFADAGSYRALFRRRFFRPTDRPSSAQALLLVAILFPIWFHIQGIIASATEVGRGPSFVWTTLLMIPALALPPVALAIYLKINLRETFSLRRGTARGWLAAILTGLGSWAVAIQFHSIQERVGPLPQPIRDSLAHTERALSDLPLPTALLCAAILPALCEETLFRGFLLAGLRRRMHKWSALIGVAVVFALYHGLIYRLPITALLGLALAYVCWQSRSIFPGMLVHAMHNGTVILLSRTETMARRLGIDNVTPAAGLPTHLWLPACLLVLAAMLLLATDRAASRGAR